MNAAVHFIEEVMTIHSHKHTDLYVVEPKTEPVARVEVSRRAYSRLDDRFLVTDAQLRDLAKHRKNDGSPMDLVSSSGKVITQGALGAAQAGYPAPLSDECALTDYCVAQLPDIKRKVHDTEYDHCFGQTKEQKRRYLLRRWNVRMSNSSWDYNLQGVREIVMVLRKSIVTLLGTENKT